MEWPESHYNNEKTMLDPVLKNLNEILGRIEVACIRSGRKPSEVRLLLATKTVDAEKILLALRSGQTLIGENKVQEVKAKYEALKDIPHEKHFIGHLQSNKIKDILKYGVTCVQSLDRLELARKLHQRLTLEKKTMDVFIQVNTSGESSKFGARPDDAVELVRQVAELDTLRIKGLMTIGLFSAEPEKVRACFKLLRSVQRQIEEARIPDISVRELSMGMSSDLEIAIEEGATIARVGTAIFGQRIYPDSYYWDEGKDGDS